MSRVWIISFTLVVLGCQEAPTTSRLSGGDAQMASEAASGTGATDGGEATTGEVSGTQGSTSESSSSGTGGTSDGGTDSAGPTSATTTGTSSASTATSGGVEESSSSSGGGVIGPGGVLDIVIYAEDDCTFTTDPASITVPEGTGFTVNWINHPTSDVEVDVAKIDQFNQVPILIGLEVGNSHHDDVREWCGALFSGTFSFRLTSCFDHHYIDVDCGGA